MVSQRILYERGRERLGLRPSRSYFQSLFAGLRAGARDLPLGELRPRRQTKPDVFGYH